MNNRKSPSKQQQRLKNTPSKTMNRPNSQSSPTRPFSTGSPPAVPVFYTTTYADPPDCSLLPPPPESWYMTSVAETAVNEGAEVAPIIQQRPRAHRQNRGSYHPFPSTRKFPAPLISVRA